MRYEMDAYSELIKENIELDILRECHPYDPVFIAQHATATCCRECISKWHKMQPGRKLSQVQQDYLVDVIMTWIEKEPVRAKEN